MLYETVERSMLYEKENTGVSKLAMLLIAALGVYGCAKMRLMMASTMVLRMSRVW